MWKKKQGKILSTIIFCLLMTTVQACHTMKIEIDNSSPHSKEVEDRNWFYLGGLFPTRIIDVSSKCPAGAAAIKAQTQFSDGFLCGITLSIGCPRSTRYYCLPEKGTELKPSDVVLKEKSI